MTGRCHRDHNSPSKTLAAKGIVLRTHFPERVTRPADFLQETGGNAKQDTHQKEVGGVKR
jgi:hypothetical protein